MPEPTIFIRSEEGKEYWVRVTLTENKVRFETSTADSLASVYLTKTQAQELAEKLMAMA